MSTNSLILKIIINGKEGIDDSIIDPISFQLIDWGLDPTSIEWNINENKASFSLTLYNDNPIYNDFSISYTGLNSIMEICYEYYFELSQTNIINNETSITTFISDYNDISFTTSTN